MKKKSVSKCRESMQSGDEQKWFTLHAAEQHMVNNSAQALRTDIDQTC